ncbi:OLC1v1007886C1 [Oldenlandia corymbosa var. corymbosa]|uniref:OLC1v1007886C1 n=1 Tax=Oldenlandia corymbosa var. corymbosa TaxID=529605 RepID=A0AAV1DLS5_OLDCO|nr:OLC1v1007886C1 [Oldenlandia corymbosa var. corymbosa]
MEGKKIEIKSRDLIKPSSPTPHDKRELKLSLIDQLAPQIYTPFLLFYKNQHHEEPSKITLHLKQSLSESLNKFYPLAGRLNPNHLCIDCDDSGALFVEAKVHGSLSETVKNAPYEHFGQYLPMEPYTNNNGSHCGAPLLAVQITWFGCGGSIIGICISHKIADFMSLLTFLVSWAAIKRDDSQKSPLVKVPNFEIGAHLFNPLEFPINLPLPAEEGKIVVKRFVFNKEKITELKELAKTSSSSSSSPSVNNFTRVEVISAFLWKHFINVTRAKNHGATIMSRIWQPVNLRNRMSSLAATSPDDEFPFGNMITYALASAVSDDSNHEKMGYGDLVHLVSDAMRKINNDYVYNSVIPFLKALGTNGFPGLTQQQSSNFRVANWQLTSWSKFPTSELDFGWGEPISAGPAAGTRTRPAILLGSKSGEEEMEAWIGLLEDEFALLPDELLSLAATNLYDLNG